MDVFEFKVNDPLKFQFRICGGASPQPAPSPESAGVITGTPAVQMGGIVLPINSTIYGTAEEVE